MPNEVFSEQEYLIIDGNVGITRVSEIYDINHLHKHEFVEICYVYSGSGSHIFSNSVSKKAEKGDLFIISKDTYHCFISDDKNNTIITYNVMFTSTFLEQDRSFFSNVKLISFLNLAKSIISTNSTIPYVHLDENVQENINTLLHTIFIEATQKQMGYINIIRAYFIEFIIKVMREIVYKSSNNTKSIIQDIIDYLNCNFSKSLDLSEIASEFHFSRNYLCRYFKKNTGMTLGEYLHHVKIEQACQQLANTQKKVIDIANDVGFTDYKAFCTIFRRVTGKRPLEYRNANKISSSLLNGDFSND